MADMPLLADFSFSQSSLQAYADCARRFWLAYVEQLPWPAVEAAPVYEHEQLMRIGATFHRLVERSELGMDPDQVAAGLLPPLSTWYTAYLRQRPADLPSATVEVERVLAIPFAPEPASIPTMAGPPIVYRLAAKYDLIAAERDGQVVIVDWKTAKRRGDPATLRQRLQSIVYPYVLVEASGALPWGPIRPEQVEMRYWFTAAPGEPVVFRYDAAQHDANRQRLQHMLGEIVAGHNEASFPKVADTDANRRRLCAYCIYRSRCDRGLAAGNLDVLDDVEAFFAVDVDKALAFTLDDVTELAF